MSDILKPKANWFRGGILTNVGARLTPQQLAELEKEARNVETMEKALASEDGEYGFRGKVKHGGQSVVSGFQDGLQTLADVVKRKHEGKPVVPVYYDDMQDAWVLTEEDRLAVMSGYLCENCLEWQEVPNSPVCKSIKGGYSCGHRPERL